MWTALIWLFIGVSVGYFAAALMCAASRDRR